MGLLAQPGKGLKTGAVLHECFLLKFASFSCALVSHINETILRVAYFLTSYFMR